MNVNIETLLKEIEKDILPYKKEYKDSLNLSEHLDTNFKNDFKEYFYSQKCQFIYEYKVNKVFNNYINFYKDRIDLINHKDFKELHFNSIFKTNDFLETI